MNNRHIRSNKTDFYVFRFKRGVFRSRFENKVEALFSAIPAYSHLSSNANEIRIRRIHAGCSGRVVFVERLGHLHDYSLDRLNILWAAYILHASYC